MDWITIVSELGFPVSISLLLILRIETAIKDLSAAVDRLEYTINKAQQED